MTRIVVTGPPGSGVSLVAAALAARLHSRSTDGDELHPPISRGRRARPADVDHEAWLRAIALVFTKDAGVVVSSGALSRADRDRIRGSARDVVFVELVAGTATAEPRRRRWRRETPLPPRPVDPLTADEAGVRIADDADLGSVVERIHAALAGAPSQSLR